MTSAFLLAAPHSGAGKTTCTLALLAALRARGLRVQSFKVGPDYIDPAHHRQITGRPSHNLDTWMLAPDVNQRIFRHGCGDVDVAVVEGVMGLFDGVDGRRASGSSADLARQLDLPVILVVDARSMARSAAALVHGYVSFDPQLCVAGVIWNRVGSANHRRILDEALDQAGLPPSLGALPRTPEMALAERHLGLVTPEDATIDPDRDRQLGAFAEAHIRIDRLLHCTRRSGEGEAETPEPRGGGVRKRIGVPRDQAYCFYYEENLRILSQAGAEIVFFRPCDGDGLPPDLDGVYLGGGYPEVHAPRIAANQEFLRGLGALHRAGIPLYAECGGFMTLCQGLTDPEGKYHPMAGIFPTQARMNRKAFRLGYREIRAREGTAVAGLVARGHEFHYSHIDDMPNTVARSFRVWNARGESLDAEGYSSGTTLAGYIHLHFGSCPEFPLRLFSLTASA